MTNVVRLSELYRMSEEDRKTTLDRLVEAVYEPPNGQIEELEARIGEFEFRYEIPSERMIEKLSSGQLRETADIASWLMLLRLREHIGSAKLL